MILSIIMRNACLGILGALSILGGTAIFAAHLTMTPIMEALNIFDANKYPNYPGIMGIVEAALAGATILVGVVSAQAVLCDSDSRNSKCPLRVSGFIYVAFALVSGVFFILRGMNTGMFMSGVCSKTDIDGCPPVRYDHLFPTLKIENEAQCMVNTWTENVNLVEGARLALTTDPPTVFNRLIDWSKDANYVAEYPEGSNKIIDAQYVPPENLYECVYWGCHPVCNDRHRMNEIWFYASAVSTALYLILAIFSLATPVNEEYNKVSTDDRESRFSIKSEP